MRALRARGAGLGAAALAALLSNACTTNDDAASQASAETTLDKAEWTEKAARLVRNGAGLGPRDDVPALLAMSKEDVIDRFMADPRFGDMVLAFNLAYLGRGLDNVRAANGTFDLPYSVAIQAAPHAFASARAVVEGGDYFSLFSGTPPLFETMHYNGTTVDKTAPLANLDRAIRTVEGDKDKGCLDFQVALYSAIEQLLHGGVSAYDMISWLSSSAAEYPRTIGCDDRANRTAAQLAGAMRDIRGHVETLLDEVKAHPAPPTIGSIMDVPAIHFAPEGLPPLATPLTGKGFWEPVPGTSTNYQRKRASYLLKTYFCDDLAPIDIPSEGDGGAAGGEAHAQNPSCQACHYRLDPMGGLLRYGGSFYRKSISFSDGVTFKDDRYEAYLDTWRNPDGSFRTGYFILGSDGTPERDPAWRDEDGDTITGLWSFLPRSKVVRSCLVRRLAEFVLGPEQVYDRAWLSEIAAELRPGPTSAVAFKSVVKKLLLSKTFSTHDPKAGTCYDVATTAPAGRAPCVIASIVEDNCQSCHAGARPSGRLDLSRWDPATQSFRHTDASGTSLPPRETFARMLERITTSDTRRRMPLLRVLPQADAATLRAWLNERLEGQP
jgi:hypothetical protein